MRALKYVRLLLTLPLSSGADPAWSNDGRALFVHASRDPTQAIDRVTVPEGTVQEVVRLSASSGSNAVDYVFGGPTADDLPLVRARNFIGNIYSLPLH